MGQGIAAKQRMESQNRPQSPLWAFVAHPFQHIVGGDGICQLAQGAGSNRNDFPIPFLHHQPEDGHAAHHLHAAQIADGRPNRECWTSTECILVHQTNEGTLRLWAAQFCQGRHGCAAHVPVIVIQREVLVGGDGSCPFLGEAVGQQFLAGGQD